MHTECFVILFARDRFGSIDERLGETRQSQSIACLCFFFTVSPLCTTPEVNRVRRGLCAPVQGGELFGKG
jgi:hypothetical protein